MIQLNLALTQGRGQEIHSKLSKQTLRTELKYVITLYRCKIQLKPKREAFWEKQMYLHDSNKWKSEGKWDGSMILSLRKRQSKI